MTRLAVAGTVAIVVFATIGQLSHDGGVSVGGYAADVLPVLGCWLAAAWWTGRFLPTWLLGVTAGVALRMVILGHYRRSELSFLVVSLAFVGTVAGVVLLVWRLWTIRHTSVTSFGDGTRLGRPGRSQK